MPGAAQVRAGVSRDAVPGFARPAWTSESPLTSRIECAKTTDLQRPAHPVLDQSQSVDLVRPGVISGQARG
jgi:hypothetical protein